VYPPAAGTVASIWVSETTLNVAFDDPTSSNPNVTAVALLNPLPVIVTAVPPEFGPLFGEIDVTTGAGT
jgi:hypothetical protein